MIRDSSSEINSNGVGAEKNSYDVRLGKKTLGSGSDISKSKKVFLGQIYELKIKPESGSAQPADSNQFSEATVIITLTNIYKCLHRKQEDQTSF